MNIIPFLMQFCLLLIMRESMIEWIFSLLVCALLLCVSLQKSAILSPCMCVYVCSCYLIDKFQHDYTISGCGRVLFL